ncbi:TRAP transporter small permease subunit [Indioceanicola profundi]|uniref:TRAP transporter small permease subunit n=1 Tax=Indioceanicola profundi TaxID=2220096 RepID=UPI000E6AB0FF|nr:TRAP transporter small permease subunit [Indioceanicola profundi]
MSALLALSRLIDAVNDWAGRIVRWLILVAVLVSAGNATVRYLFDTSSNAWLELQWYLFAAVFLLCAGYTFLRNEHIRIDVVASRFSRRTQAWIDVFGILFFLMPFALLITWLSIPFVEESIRINEMSSDAGGLLRWPVKLLVPVGFVLLMAQAVSELIKRLAFIAGAIDSYAPAAAGPHGHGETA